MPNNRSKESNPMVFRSKMLYALLLVFLTKYDTKAFAFQTSRPILPTTISYANNNNKGVVVRPLSALTTKNDGDKQQQQQHQQQQETTKTESHTTNNDQKSFLRRNVPKYISTTMLITAVTTSLFVPSSSSVYHHPNSAYAYETTDYASDAVTDVVKSLKDSAGDNAATMKTFTDIAEIITDGKGVGGSQSYAGVNLEKGFVADEDTSIYNPGLSILTESEKERITEAVISNRKNNQVSKTWSEDAEFAYSFLKTRLDPLHMAELKGYLGILPFYGAALYLGSLAAQQSVRDIFPFVYIVCAVGVFLPVVALVLLGS